MDELARLLRFVSEVLFVHYITLLTGGVVMAIVGFTEHKLGRSVSWKAFRWVAVGLLVLSIFLAWRERDLKTEELSKANVSLAAIDKEKDRYIEQLLSRSFTVQLPPSPQQPEGTKPQVDSKQMPAPIPTKEEKQRAMHDMLVTFIQQGKVIESRLAPRGSVYPTWDDKTLPVKKEAQTWVIKVESFLKKNFDQSYVERFRNAYKWPNEDPNPIAISSLLEFRITVLQEFLR